MTRRIIPKTVRGQCFQLETDGFHVFRRLSGLLLALAVVSLTACGPARQEATNHAPTPAAVGGPFALTDQNGARATEALLRGKWTLVFFGYTFCPDVCPVTLSNLGGAMQKMGSEAKGVRVIFITVDPDRDTPAQLKTYLSSPSFPPGTIGLTGTAAQVASAARAYHVYFRKAGTGASYSVDHTSVVYLMNPQGQFDRPVDVGATPQGVASQIESAMRGA